MKPAIRPAFKPAIKPVLKIYRQYAPCFLLLIGMDVFSSLLLWLADAEAFYSLLSIIVLTSILLFSAMCYVLGRLNARRIQAYKAFLDQPDECHEKLLVKAAGETYADDIHLLGFTLREKINAYEQAQMQLSDYEEYVEAWAHETKAPLSLLTMILDNRRDELPEQVSLRLDIIRSRIQESTNHMLYYARLKSSRKDYLFEPVSIRSCIEEVLEDYMPLLEEKQFQIEYPSSGCTVYTDRRGLLFLLGQAVSNAVKYSNHDPVLCFTLKQTDREDILHIRDQGLGVRLCDLPYIFEKGFTGDTGSMRRHATGMGLYLAKEMAKDLGLQITASSEWGKGFDLKIIFPSAAELLEHV